MPEKPFIKFYPNDWLAEFPGDGPVSLAAQGLWVRILCRMDKGNPRGTFTEPDGQPVSVNRFGYASGLSESDNLSLFQELKNAKVFSEIEINGSRVICSRRMMRDTEKTERNRRNGAKGGNPKLVGITESDNRPLNRVGYPSGITESDKLRILEIRSSSLTTERGECEGGESRHTTSEPEPPMMEKRDEREEAQESEETSDSVFLEFACDGPKQTWSLSDSLVREWAKVYPAIDVRQELRKAQQWVKSNPERRKTAKGMRRYLTGWLNRAAERASSPVPLNARNGAATTRREQGMTTPDRYADEVDLDAEINRALS